MAPAGQAARVADVSETVRLVAVRDTDLSLDEVYRALDHPQAGGVAVFVGTVRDHDGGKGVDSLDYSSHPTAESVMRQIADEVVRDHDVLAAAVVHRIGLLAIGDIAVIAGVACAHRGEAFDACERLIDEVKARTPIWKHQSFSDGTEEWVGTP